VGWTVRWYWGSAVSRFGKSPLRLLRSSDHPSAPTAGALGTPARTASGSRLAGSPGLRGGLYGVAEAVPRYQSKCSGRREIGLCMLTGFGFAPKS
jgi:hypothetical protein